MAGDPTLTKEELRRLILDAGAVAVGFAQAAPVSAEFDNAFSRWLAEGNAATMHWLGNHRQLRSDPRLLLEGARTVISVAFPYFQPQRRRASLPQISMYAYGRDYHKVIPKLLRPVCRQIAALTGASTRICVDSAPVAERYWAMRAGIGRRGQNGSVIIDGYGSFVFLTEILTSLEIEPDAPSTRHCSGCGRCRAACPGHAIGDDSMIRPQRCLSYLTIEHDAASPLEQESLDALASTAGRNTLYGCDICQSVCPHNAHLFNRKTPPDIPPDLLPHHPLMLTLGRDKAVGLTDEEWTAFTAGSAMRRAPAAMLHASALRLSKKDNTSHK